MREVIRDIEIMDNLFKDLNDDNLTSIDEMLYCYIEGDELKRLYDKFNEELEKDDIDNNEELIRIYRKIKIILINEDKEKILVETKRNIIINSFYFNDDDVEFQFDSCYEYALINEIIHLINEDKEEYLAIGVNLKENWAEVYKHIENLKESKSKISILQKIYLQLFYKHYDDMGSDNICWLIDYDETYFN